MKACKQCGLNVKTHAAIYCSNKCQSDYQYSSYIEKWKQGLARGDRGIHAKNISGHIKRYIFEKYNFSCAICSWGETNPYTNKVPVEIDHIDGNSENNVEENLRLICPNCHSLTASFRNLNYGNGRQWRRNKYLKSH